MEITFYTDNYFQGRHLVTIETVGDKIMLTYEGEDGRYYIHLIETLGA